MGFILYLDTILVPFSLFITVGYHAYLWHNFRHKPSFTTIGLNFLKRRSWLQEYNQGDDKKGMLAVQSLRNTLMETILTASITIIISISLAALANNTYSVSSSSLFQNPFFGSQSSGILVLKFGAAALFLLTSFLCSSMALGCLTDANFLINALGELSSSTPEYTQTVLERGFMLSVIGNRVFCISIPLLLWMFGPVVVAFSSLALVWGLYELDFVRKWERF